MQPQAVDEVRVNLGILTISDHLFQYEDMIEFFKELKKNPEENPLHEQFSESIEKTLCHLEHLFVAMLNLSVDKDSIKSLTETHCNFNLHVLSDSFVFSRIQILTQHNPKAKAFCDALKNLQKITEGDLLAQVYGQLASMIKGAFTGCDLKMMKEKIEKECALRMPVNIPTPARIPGARGENVYLSSGQPGRNFAPMQPRDYISLLPNSYKNKYPIRSLEILERYFFAARKQMDKLGMSPAMIYDVIANRTVSRPIANDLERLANGITILFITEMGNARLSKVKEGLYFLEHHLKTHTSLCEHFFQLTGEATQEGKIRVITECAQTVLDTFVKNGDIKD